MASRNEETAGVLAWLGSSAMLAVSLIAIDPSSVDRIASAPELDALCRSGAWHGVRSPFLESEEARTSAVGTRGAMRALVGLWTDRAASSATKDAARQTLRESAIRLQNRAAGLRASASTPATEAAEADRLAAGGRVERAALNRQAIDAWLDTVLNPELAGWLKGFGTVTLALVFLAAFGIPLATLAYFLTRKD